MKQHILVATDGSETAQKAVTMAAELAAKFDIPLTIGHALQFGKISNDLVRMAEAEHILDSVKSASKIDFDKMREAENRNIFSSFDPPSDTVRAITLIGEELVKRAADRARDIGASKVDTRTVDDDPANGVLEMAKDVGADMIVIGHRGLGRVRSLLVGSVAHKVNSHATCTVVTVR
ncbi:universal stress protein [Roseovarius sp. S4756]|uniref:universal stress protein n=1 Tax=Roseovarius maritimus TaxID=3342637 RepID=UPI0037271300